MLRLRTAMLAVVVATAACGLSASPAAAADQLAACDATTATGLQWAAPSFMAWGRQDRVGANAVDPGDGPGYDDGSLAMSVDAGSVSEADDPVDHDFEFVVKAPASGVGGAAPKATWTMVDATGDRQLRAVCGAEHSARLRQDAELPAEGAGAGHHVGAFQRRRLPRHRRRGHQPDRDAGLGDAPPDRRRPVQPDRPSACGHGGLGARRGRRALPAARAQDALLAQDAAALCAPGRPAGASPPARSRWCATTSPGA